jgi:uncharacterized protein YbaR (Trm112 family)
MTSKSISFKTTSVERISSYGQILSCPVCERTLMLKDTRDGDQAYWCHTCERGWRAGHLPPEARRAKAKALLEESLEVIAEPIIPEPVVIIPVKKPPVSKTVLPQLEVPIKTKIPRVAKVIPMTEPIILETAKVRSPRVPNAVLPQPVALIPEPTPKVSSRQPKATKPEQKAMRLEPMPEVVRRTKKPKLEPKAPILEPVAVLPKPTAKTRVQRLAQVNTAQLDLFA